MTAASKERCLKDSQGAKWLVGLLCGKQAKITLTLKSHPETSKETHKKNTNSQYCNAKDFEYIDLW